MRHVVIALSMLLGAAAPAGAQFSLSLGLPGVSIGINVPVFPELVPVPGYPVYYAPQLQANFFFYVGMYWVYENDNWYASTWYNGPWGYVAPEVVPVFILRVPVRYFRSPPAYFRGWRGDAPPRWGEHWGHDWEQRHGDWDRWDRRSAPAPAPLPTYQRQYSGDRYPDAGRQRELRDSNYRYQPHEAVVRQQYSRPAPAPAPRTDRPQPSAPSPAPERGNAPERADRGNAAGHTDARPATPAQAPDARRVPAERSPAAHDTQAPAKRDAQPKPAEQARSAPSPDANQQRQRQQEQQQQKQQQQKQQQQSQRHEAQAPRGRESADKPQAKAPEHEQKKEPERDH